jgi:YidC/Oxa1 family membrane protein insertase
MKVLIFPVLCLGACLLLPVQLRADVAIETSTMVLNFNDQGSLVEARACHPQCLNDAARRLELKHVQGIISFDQDPAAVWVQHRGLPGEQEQNGQQLHFTSRGGQSITWIVPAEGYRIRALVTNTSALVIRAGAEFKPRPAAGFGGWLEQVRYVAVGTGGVRQLGLDQEEPGRVLTDWAGFRNRFWAVLASGHQEDEFDLQTGAGNTDLVLRHSGDLTEEQYLFYLGPVEPGELAAVDPLLGDLMYAGLWFWLRWICFGLYFLLGWIQSFVPSWGAAVMLLSLAVHILMLPLSRKADRIQQQVHATEARLAPELSRIKKSWRGEEQAARTMALYRREGISPLYSLKSMLGVAIVIPVFIGAFDMLAENIHLLHTGFLWIRDLSRPDALMQLPFDLPFFGSELNLLPFMMTGLSVLASLLHKPLVLNSELRRQQLRNMSLLALTFFVLFYTFPAGMVLYWTSDNLIAVCKGFWALRKNTAGT